MSTALKERLEARISREQKRLLAEAAGLRGQSLSEFVVQSAQEAARRTLEEYRVITLTQRDRDAFVKALLKPATPSSALKKAADRYRKQSTD
jgi:uncharacterized protein (DUF1778 family)